ncbi:MAG: hypothetical protein Q8O87_03735 [bacterium]|nr:hypothetical protein [bacterium]
MQVIPVINVKDVDVAKDRVNNAAEFTNLAHLDISDGIFTSHKSWGNPVELSELMSGLKPEGSVKEELFFEIHLMVANPEEVIEDWLKTNLVKRVVVHVEAVKDILFILEKCRQYGAEAMLAAKPDTDAQKLIAHSGDFKYFQILAVSPGPAGQGLLPGIIDKVKSLRSALPNAIIEIDGGVDISTIKQIKDAGADIVVSGTYIFSNDNPSVAYQKLVDS